MINYDVIHTQMYSYAEAIVPRVQLGHINVKSITLRSEPNYVGGVIPVCRCQVVLSHAERVARWSVGQT